MQIYCFTCLYQKSQVVLRPDGTCKSLPAGQTFNDNIGIIEGCDTETCNCSGSSCSSCKNSVDSIYPDFESCSKCNSSREKSGQRCLKCTTVQYLQSSNKTCQSCSIKFTKCSQCNETKCLKCESNYGIDIQTGKCIYCSASSDKVNIGIYCISKPNGCLKLTASSINELKKEIICDQCVDINFYKDKHDGSCFSKCPFTTSQVGQYCEKCQNNCQSCPNLTGCTMCDSESLIYQGSCISLYDCTNKKGYNNNGYCEICPNTSKYSSYCPTKGQCGECKVCDEKNQFYKDYSNNCNPCHFSCQTCRGGQDYDCLSCALPGYVLENNKCICKDSSLCLHCNSASNCFYCKQGYQLDQYDKLCRSSSSNACSSNCCPKGYSDGGLRCTCQASNCFYCNKSDGTKCQLCVNGYELDQNEYCVQKLVCNPGYTVNKINRSCDCSVTNCKNCNKQNGQKCDECAYNYVYDSVLLQCQCQAENCSICDQNNGKKCKVCSSNQFILNQYGECESKVENCNQLDPSDPTLCTTCRNNFAYNQSTKKCECTIPKCINCQLTLQGDCIQCQTGYIWSRYRNSCVCSAKNCDKCEDSNGSECQKCKSGFTLNSNTKSCEYTCIVENCSKCDASSKGTQCQSCVNSNFKITSKFECSCQLNNCTKCSNINIGECEKCQDGFILDSKQCKCQFKNCNLCGLDSQNKPICKQCEDGYKFINGQCEYTCLLTKCKKCEKNTDVCTECEINFAYNNSSRSCECNIKVCQSCDTNIVDKCNSCKSGYNIDQNNKCNCISQQCKECDLTNGNWCKTCNDGYSLDQNSKCYCALPNCDKCGQDSSTKQNICLQCKNGYQKIGNICKYTCQLNKCKNCDENSSICNECETNYQYNSQTQKCECKLKSCADCDTSVVNKCNSCTQGYSFNSSNQCVCVLQNCKTCNESDGNNCQQCENGYTWNSAQKKCESNIPNCEKIHSSGLYCEKCFGNYIPNSTDQKTCECKMKACLKCESDSTNGNCKQCQTGYEWNNLSKTCECSEYKKCTKCDSSDGSICLNCIQGFTIDPSSNKCKCSLNSCLTCSINQPGKCESCFQNYILDSQGKCQCNISNCQSCDQNDGSICSTCNNGYKWDNNKKQCEIKIENCIELDTYDSNICKKCLNNYKFNNQSKKCECTFLNCKSCALNNNNQCSECQPGYKLDSQNQQSCINLCTDTKCSTCQNDPKKCDKCVVNHELLNNVCQCTINKCSQCSINSLKVCDVCNDGYVFDSSSNSCICAIEKCNKCEKQNNNYICTVCQDGYKFDLNLKKCECIFPLNGKCQVCPQNFIFDYQSNKCICQNRNCEKCDQTDGSKCIECKTGFKQDNANQTCLNECILGYKMINNQCECEDSNCSQCNKVNGKICNLCKQDYEVNPQTNKCECKIKNCTNCINNTCQQCKNGFEVQNNYCVCKIEQCKVCSDLDDGKCKDCKNGYSLSQDQKSCQSSNQCIELNCKQCDQKNKCISCLNGYYLSEKQSCVLAQEKYIFKLKQQLIPEGYKIQIIFEQDLVESSKEIDLKKIIQLNISNTNNYTYELRSNSRIIEAIVIMKEDCKQQKVNVNIIDDQFYNINNLKKREDSLHLDTFVVVPKELKEQTEKTTQTTKVLNQSALGIAALLAIMGGFYLLFGILDVSAYIYYLFFVNVRFPYNVVEFSKLFVDFQFTFIPNIFLPMLDDSYKQNSPSKFKENGTDSYFIRNTGRFLFMICLVIALYIFLKLVSLAPFGRLQRYLIQKVTQYWEYNAFISIFWFTYIYLSVSCFLQFNIFEIHEKSSYFNYTILFCTLIALIVTPVYLTKVLFGTQSPTTDQLIQTKYYFLIAGLSCSSSKYVYKSCFDKLFNSQHSKLNQDEDASPPLRASKERVLDITSSPEMLKSGSSITRLTSARSRLGSVINLNNEDNSTEFNLLREMNKYTYTLQFYRKFLYSLFIVYLHDYSQTQLACISFLNGYFALYYIVAQPFGKIYDNIKSGLTEIIFITLHILVAVLKQDDLGQIEIERVNIGWGIIALCILALTLQIVGMIIDVILKFKEILQKDKISNQTKTLPIQEDAFNRVNKVGRNQTEITSLQYKMPYFSNNQGFSSQAQFAMNGKEDENQNGIEAGLTQVRKGRRIRNFTNLIFDELNVIKNTQQQQSSNASTIFDLSPLTKVRSTAASKTSLDSSPMKSLNRLDSTSSPKKKSKK